MEKKDCEGIKWTYNLSPQQLSEFEKILMEDQEIKIKEKKGYTFVNFDTSGTYGAKLPIEGSTVESSTYETPVGDDSENNTESQDYKEKVEKLKSELNEKIRAATATVKRRKYEDHFYVGTVIREDSVQPAESNEPYNPYRPQRGIRNKAMEEQEYENEGFFDSIRRMKARDIADGLPKKSWEADNILEDKIDF
jgi:hypothetical protein